MLTEDQKPTSIEFWNKKAQEWDHLTYDPQNEFRHYPTSQVRQSLTVNLAKENLPAGAKVLDIGCATGQLVIDMAGQGFEADGIDNAAQMVEQARKRAAESGLSRPERFQVADIDRWKPSSPYAGVSAMGLVEYVKDTTQFFDNLQRMLSPNGLAFIESRNSLFNLYSANHYLEASAEKSNIGTLLTSLNDAARFSPVSLEQSADLVHHVYQRIGEEMRNFKPSPPIPARKIGYPFALPQYTPQEMEAIGAKAGLTLEKVVYYHFHPFLPAYEGPVGTLFNKLAVLMQPLGDTPLAATLCSSFIAVYRK